MYIEMSTLKESFRHYIVSLRRGNGGTCEAGGAAMGSDMLCCVGGCREVQQPSPRLLVGVWVGMWRWCALSCEWDAVPLHSPGWDVPLGCSVRLGRGVAPRVKGEGHMLPL